MKARPLLFSAPMVRALLDGRKSQTRRIVKVDGLDFIGGKGDSPNSPGAYGFEGEDGYWWVLSRTPEDGEQSIPCPYGQPGDLLWVRETCFTDDDRRIAIYVADGTTYVGHYKKRPSIHMPRWVSRLTLKITEVRVQRLQEISDNDARAEGIGQTWGDFMGNAPEWAHESISSKHGAQGSHLYDNRRSSENFRFLWESLNGPGSWEANPWVWAISFEVIKANVNAVMRGQRE